MLPQRNEVLVVVAHPDDEILGLAGTIRKHVLTGDRVHVLALTDGYSSRASTADSEGPSRKKAALTAAQIVGFNWLESEPYPDNALDSVSLLKVVKEVENAKALIEPSMLYTHSSADLNIDHQIVSRACLTAFRPQPKEACKEIRLFETPSATDYGHPSVTGQFIPNLYIDIATTWEVKEKALEAYRSELREFPHSRSMEAITNLAATRGCQVGLSKAEAFEVIRKVET